MVELTESTIDHAAVTERVRSQQAGAVCTFLGTTRDLTGDLRTTTLHYEAHAPMALRQLAQLEAEARGRWPILETVVVHRVGRVDPGEISVVVAVSSPHRREAFEACQWLMDRLKEVVPIWKQETRADGSASWVHPGLDAPVSVPEPAPEA